MFSYLKQALSARLSPQCNTNSPPNLQEWPLATAARLFSQLRNTPHPSFLGSRFLCGSVLSARVNRVLINGSQGVQSPGAAVASLLLVSVCCYSCEEPLACGPLCSALLKFCPIFSHWHHQTLTRNPGLALWARIETKDEYFFNNQSQTSTRLSNVISLTVQVHKENWMLSTFLSPSYKRNSI